MYSALMYIPLFWIFDSPLFVGMFIIPLITLILTLYWWCRLFPKKDNLLWGVIGLLLILWSPFNSGILHGDFYIDSFSVPWVLASLLFFREKRETHLLISLFLVVGFKIYFAAFASLACFLYYAENRSIKVVLAGCGFIIYFLFIIFAVLPYLNRFNEAALIFTWGQEIKGIFAWFTYFYERLFNWNSLKYIFNIFGVFLFIPFLSPKLSLLALPIIGIHSIFFSGIIPGPHYHALPTTILAVAFVPGCKDLKKHFKIWRSGLFQFTLAMMILVSFCYYGQIPSHLLYKLSKPLFSLLNNNQLLNSPDMNSKRIVFPSGVQNSLYRLREDLHILRSKPDYVSEIKKALSRVQPEELMSVVPKLSPYLVKNPAWIFPRPFNQKNLGEKVDRVIIAKHHHGYLDRLGGSTQEFSQFINILQGEYNMKIEVESDNILVLTK
ncbi:MAG: hypothetical protein CMG57_09180 [Candidatus Marinimicrobia bacterium]|nr:hypothetical protein [Candidatus Neomarinimicrobiota bacterium]